MLVKNDHFHFKAWSCSALSGKLLRSMDVFRPDALTVCTNDSNDNTAQRNHSSVCVPLLG